MEQWKPVVGFEGFYEVSDLGRVKRIATWVDNWGTIRQPNPNPLKPGQTNGYLQCHLAKNGVKYCRYLHQLVAEAFIGPTPDGMEVNHKDGVKADCSLGNLEYKTHQENLIHSSKILKNKHGNFTHGDGHPRARANSQQVLLIRKMYARKERIIDIANYFGFTHGCVSAIVKRKCWKHI